MSGLTPEQIAKRRYSIGSSDAGRIMRGEWADLWLEKTGRTSPADLSCVLPVQIGIATEALNLRWFVRTTQMPISDCGLEVEHPEHPWMTATLDARAQIDGLPPVEAKHVGGREPMDVVAQRYMPQLHHQMAILGVRRAYLSVIVGTDRYEWLEVPFDDFYAAELIDREQQFWTHVQTDTPPPDMPAVVAPVPPEKWRSVDLTGNNLWAEQAGIWLDNGAAAKRFEKAAKEIKSLVEPDVGKASGHGIIVSRSKAGSLTIKEARA